MEGTKRRNAARAVSTLSRFAERVVATRGLSGLPVTDAVREDLRKLVGRIGSGDVAKARGSGFTALFTGASGTTGTMAAAAFARELGRPLYRVVLDRVSGKSIGETEKNLQKLFDAAERGQAVLLFDEADALFGKRSDVRDSHDRYANFEANYLLDRLGNFAGIAILTSNGKHPFDRTFLRRLGGVIDFDRSKTRRDQ